MVDTPMWRKFWPEFEEVMKRRLEAGHMTYGDGSFGRPPRELTVELEEEALDIVGWGFILWTRLRRLREVMEDNELEHKEAMTQLDLPFDGGD